MKGRLTLTLNTHYLPRCLSGINIAPKDPGLALCSFLGNAFTETSEEAGPGLVLWDARYQNLVGNLWEIRKKVRGRTGIGVLEREKLHGVPNCLFFIQLGSPDISSDCLGTRPLKDSRPEGANSSAKSCKRHSPLPISEPLQTQPSNRPRRPPSLPSLEQEKGRKQLSGCTPGPRRVPLPLLRRAV